MNGWKKSKTYFLEIQNLNVYGSQQTACFTKEMHYYTCIQSGIVLQWWRDLFRCRIDLLNFSTGFNIIEKGRASANPNPNWSQNQIWIQNKSKNYPKPNTHHSGGRQKPNWQIKIQNWLQSKAKASPKRSQTIIRTVQSCAPSLIAPYMEFLHLNWYIDEWLGWVPCLCTQWSAKRHSCKWLSFLK